MAGGHGECELTEGIADGVDLFADLNAFTVTDDDGREAGGIDLQNGNIVFFLNADDGGIIGLAVVEHDRNLVIALICSLDDMVVCNYISVSGNDKA